MLNARMDLLRARLSEHGLAVTNQLSTEEELTAQDHEGMRQARE